MIKPVGGRGKRAPYETVQMRVPLPIKSEVEKLIEDYRAVALGNETPVEKEDKPVNKFLDHLHYLALGVLSDPVVTRNGKDRGAAKRALDAFIQELSKQNNSENPNNICSYSQSPGSLASHQINPKAAKRSEQSGEG